MPSRVDEDVGPGALDRTAAERTPGRVSASGSLTSGRGEECSGCGGPRSGHRSRFGRLSLAVDTSGGRVVVSGAELPRVEVQRRGSADRGTAFPLGTRDPAKIELRIDGRRIDVEPGKGVFRRSTYRVRADLGDRDLLLTPSSPAESRRVRGGSWRGARNELGYFTLVDAELVVATWICDDPRAPVPVRESALTPEPREAAVAYALSAAFGTGAQLMFLALASHVGDAVFPR